MNSIDQRIIDLERQKAALVDYNRDMKKRLKDVELENGALATQLVEARKQVAALEEELRASRPSQPQPSPDHTLAGPEQPPTRREHLPIERQSLRLVDTVLRQSNPIYGPFNPFQNTDEDEHNKPLKEVV